MRQPCDRHICALALKVAVLVAFTACWLGADLAERAEAGAYSALGCAPHVGALMLETTTFETNDPTHLSGRACSPTSSSLRFTADIANPSRGSLWRWRIPAPPGLQFIGGSFSANPGQATGSYLRQYLYRLPSGAESGRSTIAGAASYSWPSPAAGTIVADELIIEMACVATVTCDGRADGDYGVLDVSTLNFSIEDIATPEVQGLSGALLEGPAQRGTQVLQVPASDQGSGIADVTVEVNGKRSASQDPPCVVHANGTALRLAPCRAFVDSVFGIDTTKPPFTEGNNTIEACVSDYAQETDDPASFAGEACASAPVYVDNSCEVSKGPDAADVELDFARKGHTVRYGTRAKVVGRLIDAAGDPIEGANVCISQRDDVAGAPEIDVGQVQTNKSGRARLKLPRGASRRVKLTYWSDNERVEIRNASLDVRARPKLEVLSDHRLSDGGTVRFRVRVPGPYRGQRKVAVQALAPAGWLDFPGCTGKTNDRGVFECSYRFREQSGDLDYRFRAIVPRQPGYPYLQGRTRVEEITVRD